MKIKLVDAFDVGELLGVSKTTIWRWRDSGTLPPPLRVGGSVRWRADVIEQWIKAGCPHCRKTGWRAEQ